MERRKEEQRFHFLSGKFCAKKIPEAFWEEKRSPGLLLIDEREITLGSEREQRSARSFLSKRRWFRRKGKEWGDWSWKAKTWKWEKSEADDEWALIPSFFHFPTHSYSFQAMKWGFLILQIQPKGGKEWERFEFGLNLWKHICTKDSSRGASHFSRDRKKRDAT